MIDGHNLALKNNSKWYLTSTSIFLILNSIFLLAFFGPIRDLLITSWNSPYYSYIPFIPVISGYLIYLNKHTIFTQPQSSLRTRLLFAGFAFVLAFIGIKNLPLEHIDSLAVMTSCMVVVWIGLFTLSYGTNSFRKAVFPLLFLFFSVPLPNALREGLILFLQRGSTEAAYGILQVTGVPVIRDGFFFHLPSINIEVAPECSGIRSGLSLIITGVLASKLFLRKPWTRIILMAAVIPIAMIKNGFRIATLSIFAEYWDAGILDSDLHHKGGIVFFILALLLLGTVMTLLKKMEKKQHRSAEN